MTVLRNALAMGIVDSDLHYMLADNACLRIGTRRIRQPPWRNLTRQSGLIKFSPSEVA